MFNRGGRRGARSGGLWDLEIFVVKDISINRVIMKIALCSCEMPLDKLLSMDCMSCVYLG
jgi:hypothetical protein